jgi:hypothetical protein
MFYCGYTPGLIGGWIIQDEQLSKILAQAREWLTNDVYEVFTRKEKSSKVIICFVTNGEVYWPETGTQETEYGKDV